MKNHASMRSISYGQCLAHLVCFAAAHLWQTSWSFTGSNHSEIGEIFNDDKL